MTPIAARGPHDTDGFALVAVLCFLLIAAAFLAPFAITARTSYLVTSNIRQQEQLRGLADALSIFLSVGAARTGEDFGIPPNSIPALCSMGDYDVAFRRQDQTGLIDLNTANESLLAIGFRSLGFEETLSGSLATTVVWYRTYTTHALAQTSQISVLAGPKHGPFESVAELFDFEPLDDVDFADLHRVFTVHICEFPGRV